jgi:amino acid transporter
MKKVSIFKVALGLILIIGGLFYYKSTGNAVDSGGSMSITTTPGGAWTVKIPMFIGMFTLILGALFYYVALQKDPNEASNHNI